MQNSSKQYFFEITSLKALSIVGVLFAHMNFVSRFNDLTIEVIHEIQLIFGWCVLAFFFSSGFLTKKLVKNIDIVTNFQNKFYKLLVPAMVFSITYKFLLIFFTKNDMADTNGIISFILIPVGPQIYFLYYLFFIAIFVDTLLKYINTKILLIVTSFLFIFSNILIDKLPELPYGSDSGLIPFYMYSYLLGIVTRNILLKNFSWFLIYVPISTMVILMLFKDIIFIYVLIPLGIFYFLQKFKTINYYIYNTYLGQLSSSIYIYHAPILMPAISILLVKIIGGGLVIIMPLLFLTIFCSFIIKILFYKFTIFKIWRF